MKIVIIILFLTVSFSYAQTDEKETLKQINQQVIATYRNQKFDEAVKLGQQAVDLSLRIYGKNNQETAVAYTNLGVIYRDKKQFKESIENLQKAVEVYESISDLKNKDQVTAYETLAFSQILGGMEKDAEANYLKAIESAESKLGKESKESFSPTLSLANLYARKKNIEKADEFYLKSYALAIKKFGKNGRELGQIEDARVCFISTQGINPQKYENFKSFYEAKKKLLGETPDYGGILNAKAKMVPKPYYPSESRSHRLSGSIAVRVKIDEQGNVFEAKTICGNEILGKASEDAVKKAKFETVSVNGKPIKYSGIIIYAYVP